MYLLVSEGGDEVCNLIIFIQSKQTSMPFIVFPDDYLQTAILKSWQQKQRYCTVWCWIVCHYDVTDKVFEKASRYEDRKQEKDKSHEKKSVLEKLEEKKDEAKATIGEKKTSYREAVSW